MNDSVLVDPKGLIRESYRIEGISAAQCRSIFLDWVLSVPDGTDIRQSMEMFLAGYGAEAPDHPMTRVMREGMNKLTAPVRRGGWRSRPRN
jgi:hypothetical protein